MMPSTLPPRPETTGEAKLRDVTATNEIKHRNKYAPDRSAKVEEAKMGTAGVVNKKVQRDSTLTDRNTSILIKKIEGIEKKQSRHDQNEIKFRKYRKISIYALPLTGLLCIVTFGSVNLPSYFLNQKRKSAKASEACEDELLQITAVKVNANYSVSEDIESGDIDINTHGAVNTGVYAPQPPAYHPPPQGYHQGYYHQQPVAPVAYPM